MPLRRNKFIKTIINIFNILIVSLSAKSKKDKSPRSLRRQEPQQKKERKFPKFKFKMATRDFILIIGVVMIMIFSAYFVYKTGALESTQIYNNRLI